MINEFFRNLIEIVNFWGGDIIKFAGDAVTVVWGCDDPADDNSFQDYGRCKILENQSAQALPKCLSMLDEKITDIPLIRKKLAAWHVNAVWIYILISMDSQRGSTIEYLRYILELGSGRSQFSRWTEIRAYVKILRSADRWTDGNTLWLVHLWKKSP